MKFIRINPEKENASEFNDYKGKMPLFIKLYSPGCPHCVNMQTAWDELEDNPELKDYNMAIIEVHANELDKINSPAVSVNGGLPTIRKVLKNGNAGKDYDGEDRSAKNMIKFIKSNFPEAIIVRKNKRKISTKKYGKKNGKKRSRKNRRKSRKSRK
jgi:glutaredoxin